MNLYSCPADEANLSEWQMRDLMCEIGRRCYASKFNDANGGNISRRLDSERVLCTPTMISKGFMQPSDLVVVNMDGEQLAGERVKSSEVLLHLFVYKHRPDINAAIHSHPRSATAFSVTNTPVPKCVIPEIEIFVGEVPITDYGDPGTLELAKTLEPYVKDFSVFLLSNHGALSCGTGLIEAFWKMEIVDAYCETVIKALSLGPLSQVSAEHMQHIFNVKKAMGIPDRRMKDPVAASCQVPAPAPKSGAPSAPSAPPCAASSSPPRPLAEGIDEKTVQAIVAKVLERLRA